MRYFTNIFFEANFLSNQISKIPEFGKRDLFWLIIIFYLNWPFIDEINLFKSWLLFFKEGQDMVQKSILYRQKMKVIIIFPTPKD